MKKTAALKHGIRNPESGIRNPESRIRKRKQKHKWKRKRNMESVKKGSKQLILKNKVSNDNKINKQIQIQIQILIGQQSEEKMSLTKISSLRKR